MSGLSRALTEILVISIMTNTYSVQFRQENLGTEFEVEVERHCSQDIRAGQVADRAEVMFTAGAELCLVILYRSDVIILGKEYYGPRSLSGKVLLLNRLKWTCRQRRRHNLNLHS